VPALNSYTSDIRFIAEGLGVGAEAQRIAGAGCECYETLMRLSLGNPTSRHDVTFVTMDTERSRTGCRSISSRAKTSTSPRSIDLV